MFSQRAIAIWNGMPQVLLMYARLDGTQKTKQLLIFVNASSKAMYEWIIPSKILAFDYLFEAHINLQFLGFVWMAYVIMHLNFSPLNLL